jgi:hypothetical protein
MPPRLLIFDLAVEDIPSSLDPLTQKTSSTSSDLAQYPHRADKPWHNKRSFLHAVPSHASLLYCIYPIQVIIPPTIRCDF